MERTNKIHAVIYTVLGIGIIAAIIWALSMNRSVKAYAIEAENNYNRAFHEMVGYINDIDALLGKAQLANDPADLATMSSDIFRKAAGAKACLGQLPTSQVNLENTAKFLSQAGDYTYVLSQNMINGQKISQEEYNTLASLGEYASKLKSVLTDIQNRIYSGELHLTDSSEKSDAGAVHAASGSIIEDLENVEKSFDEYPSLIYDGPFSEHIENQQSVMLSQESEVTREEAQKAAEDFLGTSVEFAYDSENTAIDSYTFTRTDGDAQLSISITKRGGHVLAFINNVNAGEAKYDPASATEKALQFLEQHGYSGMVSSYYDVSANIATINFAASQQEVICYSDLIKVRVALDTGDIVGMEAKGYLMNHREREGIIPTLTEEQARERVSTSLDVNSAGLAVIPKDSLREVLCYEFRGAFNGRNFIVYINADNGHEEKILLLLESESGILTV